MSEANLDWLNTPESEEVRENKEKVIHPAGGPYIIRAADWFPGKPGKDPKTGAEYPRLMFIFLSEENDTEGKPLWLFTTAGKGMGATKKGKPRLRVIAEAFLAQVMGEDEARNTTPKAIADLIVGRYAQGTVSHWGGIPPKGAQIDVFMPLRPGASHPTIDLSTYKRPEKFGGSNE